LLQIRREDVFVPSLDELEGQDPRSKIKVTRDKTALFGPLASSYGRPV